MLPPIVGVLSPTACCAVCSMCTSIADIRSYRGSLWTADSHFPRTGPPERGSLRVGSTVKGRSKKRFTATTARVRRIVTEKRCRVLLVPIKKSVPYTIQVGIEFACRAAPRGRGAEQQERARKGIVHTGAAGHSGCHQRKTVVSGVSAFGVAVILLLGDSSPDACPWEMLVLVIVYLPLATSAPRYVVDRHHHCWTRTRIGFLDWMKRAMAGMTGRVALRVSRAGVTHLAIAGVGSARNKWGCHPH